MTTAPLINWSPCGLLALFLLFSSGVMAKSPCELHLSEGTINYGKFTRGDVLHTQTASGYLSMGKRILSLASTCGADTVMGISFNGTSQNEKSYRLDKNASFTLKIVSAQLDGRPVQMRTLQRVGAGNRKNLIRPGDTLIPHEGESVARGERLNLQIEVQGLINEAGLRVNSEKTVEGHGEFHIRAM